MAITGLTTPGGSENRAKPVGTIFFHIITPTAKIIHRQVFKGDAEKIVLQAIDKTAQLILNSFNNL